MTDEIIMVPTGDGHGIRDLYRDDIRDDRMTHLRPKLSKPLKTYLDDHILDRPLFAFHQLARLSELLLYKATHGRKKYVPYKERCEMLFIEVRREQRNILSKYSINKPIPRGVTPTLRHKAEVLLTLARSIASEITTVAKKAYCPCCRGKGTVTEENALLLRAFIREAVAEGKLPEELLLERPA